MLIRKDTNLIEKYFKFRKMTISSVGTSRDLSLCGTHFKWTGLDLSLPHVACLRCFVMFFARLFNDQNFHCIAQNHNLSLCG